MAYKEDYYEEVDKLFDTIKTNPFVEKDGGNAVSQEEQGQIQPVGWVENADASDGSATVKIDSDGITITDGKLSVSDASGNSIISGGVVKALTNDGAEVVIDGDGITITDGALTVSNPTGTVIIDGSSNMFKIAATGTVSIQGPNGTSTDGASTTGGVNIATGFTYRPSFLQYVDTGGFATQLPFAAFFDNLAPAGHAARNVWGYTSVVNTNQTRIEWGWHAFLNDSTNTWPFRYYILQEAAV
jgi:hypothetical protein